MNKASLFAAALLLILLLPLLMFAQSPPAYAFENVTIHHSDGSVMESGKIIWRNGVIEAVGSNPPIPYDAYTVIDGGDSLHVYAGFIDGLGTWGSPDLLQRYEHPENPGDPGYERAGIQPNRSAGDFLNASGSTITDVMKTGITAANLGLKGFMLAGQPDLFFLNGEETSGFLFKKSTGYQFAFNGAPAERLSRAYPVTTMGVMARFRQLMYDTEALWDHIRYFADANGSIKAPKRDLVLESLFPVLGGEAPLFAEIDSPENLERLMVLKEEFGLNVIIVSGKSVHYKASELARTGIPVLSSVELPEKPGWIEDGDEIAGEEENQHRERQARAYRAAAQNIRTLLDAGVTVGFASKGLQADEILESLRTLREEGELTDDEILRVLTINTAEILNSGATLGRLRAGSNASFSIFDSPFLEEEASVKMVISNGEIHEF